MGSIKAKIKNTFQGFSLLELLFVVSLLAMLATFGLATYKQRTVNEKVVSTASHIVQILQAGSAFFIDKGEWPIFQSPTGEEFEKNYLPFEGVLKNPWNLEYVYRPFSSTFSDIKKARLFEVETLAPTYNIAALIAARLPHSKVEASNDAYIVKSQIAIPGQNADSDFQNLNVQTTGQVTLTQDNSSRKIKFDCPEGMKRGVIVMLLSVDSGDVGGAFSNLGTTLAKFSTDRTQCDQEGCTLILDMHYWHYCAKLHKGDCWIPGAKATFQYIAYCMEEKFFDNTL